MRVRSGKCGNTGDGRIEFDHVIDSAIGRVAKLTGSL